MTWVMSKFFFKVNYSFNVKPLSCTLQRINCSSRRMGTSSCYLPSDFWWPTVCDTPSC